MVKLRRIVLAGIATVVFAGACTTITVPTLPPINIPSIPPINIPTLPPINIPSFAIPSFDIPSFAIPSFPPVGSPVPVGQSTCALVTADEMATVFGGTVTLTPGETGDCTITPQGELIGIILRNGQGESISAAKLITSNGEDLTIAGAPAYYGEFMGGILYIEKNGKVLVLQAPLNNDLKDKLIAAANVAVPRLQ